MENVFNLLTEISRYSVLIPIIASLIKIKALNKTLRALLFYLMACLLAEVLSFILFEEEKKVNIVFNCFTVLEGIIICYIYYIELLESKFRALALFALGFLLFSASYFFVVKHLLTERDNTVSTVEAVLIVILSGLYFYKLTLDNRFPKLETYYFYWINFAFLLYFGGAFLLFMNTDFIEKSSPTTVYTLWGLHQALNIISYILLSVGIWKLKQK